jgi:hypothetical protein
MIFVIVGDQVFYQSFEISHGMNCAVLVADLRSFVFL